MIRLPISVAVLEPGFGARGIKRYSLRDADGYAIGVAYADRELAERVAAVINAGETNLVRAESKASQPGASPWEAGGAVTTSPVGVY